MARDKLRTSREIFDQIRWDARLDDTRVLVGYQAQGKGLEELPFREFVPDGEIPWHRIWYFRGPDGLLWDRKERIDRLQSLPAEPVLPLRSSLTPLPSFRFEEGVWVVVETPAAASELTTFRVLTWNVLFDLFDGEHLEPAARQERLLEHLEALQPEVIALQEVTPRLVAALTEKPWVRERYTLTEGPAAEGVTPYGVLLLSRVPLNRVAEHRFTRDKRILVAELTLAASPVAVAVVHFTSDRAQNGSAIRGRERHVLLDLVLTAPEWSTHDWLVVGDVNFHRFDGNEPDPFARGRLMDVWASMQERDAGYTFDPVRNPLARATSSSGDRRRLDRVFLRKEHGVWAARSIRLVGQVNAPSDHFGLLCELGPDAARERPVSTSALVIIPPRDAWKPIQALREKHDRHARRWMPHLTLLFGFVPQAQFPEAQEALRRLLASRRPFRIRFRTVRAFQQGEAWTLYAAPEPSTELLELQTALEAEFPLCQEQSAQGPGGFLAHLTLGQCAPAALEETLALWQRGWVPFEMEVGSLSLIAREADTAFGVWGDVALGASEIALPPAPEAPRLQRQEHLTLATQPEPRVSLESRALLAWVEAHAEPGLFRAVLDVVLRWARAREVDSEALGYPGEHAWALLVAASFREADSDASRSASAMLGYFFRRYADWAWPRPVSLGGEAVEAGAREVVVVFGLGSPRENTTPAATWSTRAVLVDELQRASETFKASPGDWTALMAPVTAWPGALELTVEPADAEALAALMGQVPRLLLALEKDPLVRVRPFLRGELLCVSVLGAQSTGVLAELTATLSADPLWPGGLAVSWSAQPNRSVSRRGK